MSPRLASASTKRPAAWACSTVALSAAQPGAPRRSKQATCGLTATTASPTASMTARQWARTPAAARAAGGLASAARTASGQRRPGSGSRPSTICDSRSATMAASRSATWPPVGPAAPDADVAPSWELALDGLLETGARGEARHLRRRDLDRLAGAGVDTLAGAALGDVELAEPREGDLATAGEGLLDDAEDGIHRRGGLLLVEIALLGDVVDELALRHCGPPIEGRSRGDASSAVGHDLALQRRFPPSATAKPASCGLLADRRRAVLSPRRTDRRCRRRGDRPEWGSDDPAAHRLARHRRGPPDRGAGDAGLALPGLRGAVRGGRGIGRDQPALSRKALLSAGFARIAAASSRL